MLLRSSQETKEGDISLDTSTASKQVVTSMTQPAYQFIEGPLMYLTVNNALYARFHT